MFAMDAQSSALPPPPPPLQHIKTSPPLSPANKMRSPPPPQPASTRTSGQPLPASSSVPAKRPAPEDTSELDTRPTSRSRPARVNCEGCGEHISFTDTATGAFTLNHWDTHLEQCPGLRKSSSPILPAAVAAPHSKASSSSSPVALHNGSLSSSQSPVIFRNDTGAPHPAKRRRAKRTEDERISYFQNDPFVARVEPYRVLCGSCNKWIRLRPNSTYCSIPWESHRKSCLAKNGKLNNTRSAYVGASASSLPPQDDPDADAEGEDDEDMQDSTRGPSAAPVSGHPSLASLSPRGDTGELDASGAPRSESRRKNESQRRDSLLADKLLTAVEPSRVYCSLCSKWVQLRQDSTYCAYPWVQHRAKCIVRNQRRHEKNAHAGGYGQLQSPVALSAPPRSMATSNGGWSQRDEEDELRSGGSRSRSTSAASPVARRGRASSRADLESVPGRIAYVMRTIDHLFATTYERGRDQLALGDLVVYLNASMPPSKYRPFANGEVAEALSKAGNGTEQPDADDMEDEDAEGELDAEGEAEEENKDGPEPPQEPVAASGNAKAVTSASTTPAPTITTDGPEPQPKTPPIATLTVEAPQDSHD